MVGSKNFPTGDDSFMDTNTATRKVAWSLAEIAEATGLSEGYLRNEVKRGTLPIKKFGRRRLVLDKDFRSFMERGSESAASESENSATAA